MSAYPLGRDLIAFLEAGHAISLAGCDAFMTPSLAPALACRASPDGQCTVWLARNQAGRLLNDIAGNGRLTLLCSAAGGQTVLQLQACDARITTLHTDDMALIDGQREAAAAQLLLQGYGAEFGYALRDCPAETLLAIHFRLAASPQLQRQAQAVLA